MSYAVWIKEGDNILIRDIDKNLWCRYTFTIPRRYYDFFNINLTINRYDIIVLYNKEHYPGIIRMQSSYKDSRYVFSISPVVKLINDFCKIKLEDIEKYKLRIIHNERDYEIEIINTTL